jgi:hypothetical protein
MAFTDNCDLFGAVHEDGVNLIIRHIMQQRPSMFNYGTADVAGNKELWCNKKLKFTDDVIKYGNPIFTVEDPLPVLGTDSPPVTLGFCVQVTKALVDFHKSNVLSLPAELHQPLQKQHLALFLQICGAIGCPSDRVIDKIPVVPQDHKTEGRKIPPVFVPGELKCFCLDVFVVAHAEREFIAGRESLVGKVDGIEIVDIKPDELEFNIECYIKTAVTLVLRQKLAIPLTTFFLQFPLFGLGTITLSPTPNPPVPNNPAVEDDQLKAFITMTV